MNTVDIAEFRGWLKEFAAASAASSIAKIPIAFTIVESLAVLLDRLEAAESKQDFHDILYGAKIELFLNPAGEDSASVPLVVGGTIGPDNALEILMYAERDGVPVVLQESDAAQLGRLGAAERDAGQWERINRVATNIRANLESLPSIASTWVADLESAMQEPQP